MAALGLPVPPAFVLPIELCAAIAERRAAGAGRQLADGLARRHRLSRTARPARRSATARRPLLVSVRSGAARSMPGMLDTVLDVGCTPAAVRGLIAQTGNPRFAYDCRRRFLESYGSVVLGIEAGGFRRAARRTCSPPKAGRASRRSTARLWNGSPRAYQQTIEDEDEHARRRSDGAAPRRGARRSIAHG